MAESVSMRLAHLVPCGENLAVDVTADLILNALYEGSKPINIDTLGESMRVSFGVTILPQQIQSELDVLLSQDHIIKVGDGYVLSSKSEEQLQHLHTQQKNLKNSAIDSWRERLLQSEPYYLDDEEAKTLADDLVAFLNTLFVRHGAESIRLISGTQNSVIDFDILGALACLPKRSQKLLEIRQVEFPRFVITQEPSEIRFLVSLIKKAVTYLSGVCDPSVISVLRERLKDKRVYLDTNVVYRLLGLQGTDNQVSIESTVNLLNSYGVKIILHNKTAEELSKRLHYDAKILKKYSIHPDLARVGTKYRSDDNYISTYWAQTSKTGISVQDFIDHNKHFMDIIHQYGVEPNIDDTRLPPDNEARLNELDSALRIAYVPRDSYGKSDSAFEHDAYVLTFIETLCHNNNPSLANSPAWFVTADRSLISFVRSASYTGPLKTLVLLPSQLFQVLQFTLPANEEYEKCFLNLFAQSYIPSYSELPNQTIHEILGRINMYRGTPQLAEKILSDTLLVRRYNTIAEDEEETRDEFIRDALTEKASETEKELERARSKMESDADKISALSSALEESNSRALSAEEQAKTTSTQLESLQMKNKKQKRQITGLLMMAYSLVKAYRAYVGFHTILPKEVSMIVSVAVCIVGAYIAFGKETGPEILTLLLKAVDVVVKLTSN